MEYYRRIKKLIVNVACKFFQPLPGLMTMTTTDEPFKY